MNSFPLLIEKDINLVKLGHSDIKVSVMDENIDKISLIGALWKNYFCWMDTEICRSAGDGSWRSF